MAKDKKKKKDNAIPVASSGKTSIAVMAAYADGQPLDKIAYLEAKLILRLDRIVAVKVSKERFADRFQREAHVAALKQVH